MDRNRSKDASEGIAVSSFNFKLLESPMGYYNWDVIIVCAINNTVQANTF